MEDNLTQFQEYIQWADGQKFNYGTWDCMEFVRLWVRDVNFKISEKMDDKFSGYTDKVSAYRKLGQLKIKDVDSYAKQLVKCGLDEIIEAKPECIVIRDKIMLGLVDYDYTCFFLSEDMGLVKLSLEDDMKFLYIPKEVDLNTSSNFYIEDY